MYKDIIIKEIINILKRTYKWKSSGRDKITNFWLYQQSFTHQVMTKLISEIFKEPEKMPDCLSEGVTIQQLKTKETANEKKRPTNHITFHEI